MGKRTVVAALIAGAIMLSLVPSTTAQFTDTARTTGTVSTKFWLAESPTALALDNTQVMFRFAPAADYSTYTVQYSTSSTFASGVSTRTVTGSEVSITGLTASTTYYFRVRPSEGGSLPWSAVASARTGPGGSYANGTQIMTYDTVIDPHGIAIDSSNRVYVMDFRLGSIYRVPATGGTATTLTDLKLTRRSGRQITLSDAAGSSVYVAHHNESGEVERIGDGLIQATGNTVTRRLTVDGAYGIARASNGNIFFTQGNANGPSRLLRRCNSSFGSCTTIFTSPQWLGYLSIPTGSNQVFFGGNGPVRRYDPATNKVEELFSVGTDVRGIHAVSENLFFFSDTASGLVWRIDYNPTTKATNSRLILTIPSARGLVTTSGGDLIVATIDSDLTRRGVWRFAGLGQ